MPSLQNFFSRPKGTRLIRKVGSKQAIMLIDVTIKETFSGVAEATKHPIEKGSDTSDHIILHPCSLALSGIMTKTPLGDFPASIIRAAGASVGSLVGDSLGRFGKQVGAAGGLLGAVGGGALGNTFAGAILGSKDKILGTVSEEFLKIRDARQPIDIQTGLKLYKNYALVSFSVNREKGTGGRIAVDLQFDEIKVVSSRITNVAIPKVIGALNKTDQGAQTPEALDATKAGKGQSLLKHLFGGGS